MTFPTENDITVVCDSLNFKNRQAVELALRSIPSPWNIRVGEIDRRADHDKILLDALVRKELIEKSSLLMVAALHAASERFVEYAVSHAQKGTKEGMEKSNRNLSMSYMCGEAIVNFKNSMLDPIEGGCEGGDPLRLPLTKYYNRWGVAIELDPGCTIDPPEPK